MGQASGSKHQGRGDKKHILGATMTIGIGGEAQFLAEAIESVE